MKKVLVVGCGGLGGYVVESLGRMKCCELILMDGDKFDESNLNRQIGATSDTIGKFKAEVLGSRVKSFGNPNVTYYNEFFSSQNSCLMDGVDLLIDCTDTIEARLLIENECEKRGLTFVSGGVEDAEGQCFLCYPGEKMAKKIYSSQVETTHHTYSYAVSVIGNLEVVLAKTFLDGKDDFKDKIVFADLDSLEIKVLKK